MNNMHPLLRRQLRKYLKVRETSEIPGNLLPFLEAVNEAYWQSDEDRKMIERSLELSSEELLSANKKLQENIKKLKELDEIKSAFLSSVSHELRTPLTSILGFAKLVERDFKKHLLPSTQNDKKLKKRAHRIIDNLEVIVKEGERLTRLINDVLDIAKIESGRIEWKDSTFNLRELLIDAAKSVSGEFTEKPHVRLIVDLPERLPNLHMDRDRLHQVLINLLNNAAKFTEKGHVKLTARSKDGKVTIAIEDTGCGIPEEDKEKIFDKFHQVIHGDTLKNKPKGTGLGLAICKQIVEHYKGKIWVKSELGKGSTFFIEFPLPEAEKEETEKLPPVLRKDRPLVLVVDDDRDIRVLLSQIFTDAGYQVITAENGKKALEISKEIKPDLITMDIMMPQMDGRTTIKHIRKDKNLKDIPVIVISVLPEKEGKEADAYVGKPIDEEHLLEIAQSFLSNSKTHGRPCLIVGEKGEGILEKLFPLCTADITYCEKENLIEKINEGFQGTIIIPYEVYEEVEIKNIKKKGVNVVII